jgi:hypothetical protein
MATSNRTETATSLLELEGVTCGGVESVDGGAISAEVFTEPAGAAPFARKHIGPPRYEEFALQLGLSMNRAVYDWIAAMWMGQPARRSGALVTAGVDMVARSRREFRDALITEVTIPAADASVRDPAFLTMKFAPERILQVEASGKVPGVLAKSAKTPWLSSNFRLEIEGLDCRRVSRINALTVRQTPASDAASGALEPAAVEFPNLAITLPEIGARSWLDWHKDFVVDGNHGDSNEKRGALVFLSPDLRTELIRISFANLGIYRLAPAKPAAGAAAIRRLTAELYCERMEFRVADHAALRPAAPARRAKRTKTRRAR